MAATPAREGEKVTEVTCRCGKQWVRQHMVIKWFCRCRRKQIGPTVTLGPGGKVPT